MRKYFVYGLRDPRKDNQLFYIGKGCGDRPKAHLNETYETTDNRKKWAKITAIRNAGLNVIIDIIKDNLLDDEAYEYEASLIQQYGRIGIDENGILTNICPDNRPPSATGREVPSITRKKIGDAQRGEKNHRFGKSWSEEEKEQRRQFNLDNNILPPDHTGRKRSDETKERQRIAATGKPKSAEHRKNMGLARKGKKFGARTPEQKKNMSDWQQRVYEFTDPTGHKIFDKICTNETIL